MNKRDRQRRLKRRQAHGPQQRQRAEAALHRAEKLAKSQKKGVKAITGLMEKLGYDFSRGKWRANPLRKATKTSENEA